MIRRPDSAPLVLADDHDAVTYNGNWTNGITEDFDASLQMVVYSEGITLKLGTDDDRSICDVYVDNVFWGSLDTYAATPGELAVTIPLARLGLHVVEIRNRPERNTACVPVSSTSFKLEFKQLETAYDGHAIDYTYDDLSRLLAADYFAAWDDANPARDYTFGYDVAGNRTSEVVNVDGAPFSSQTHTYDAANRISSAGFAYDNAGRMTSDGTNTYSWDRANRLLGMGSASYAYNGLGQRVQQTVSGVVTDYLLDVQPGLAKVIAAMTGANTERFVYDPMGVSAQQDSVGDWTWMVKDGLGSVRGVIDDGFDAIASRHFAPYGVSYGEQGSFTVPFAFTGEMLDANGLQYHRARYYNPALGVFPSLDPLEGVLQQAMSLNRYGYVGGNVVNLVDPSGLVRENPGDFDQCAPLLQGSNCCGFDVTAWFLDDLKIHWRWAMETSDTLDGPYGLFTYGPAPLLIKFAAFLDYAKAIPYKWMNFDPLWGTPGRGFCSSTNCRDTVTLCGACIHKSELGNIVYGAIGAGFLDFGTFDDELLWYGGRFAQGLSRDVEEAAVGIGISLQREYDIERIQTPIQFCNALRNTHGGWTFTPNDRVGEVVSQLLGDDIDFGSPHIEEWSWSYLQSGPESSCRPSITPLFPYPHTEPGIGYRGLFEIWNFNRTGGAAGTSGKGNRPGHADPFYTYQLPYSGDWAYLDIDLCNPNYTLAGVPNVYYGTQPDSGCGSLQPWLSAN